MFHVYITTYIKRNICQLYLYMVNVLLLYNYLYKRILVSLLWVHLLTSIYSLKGTTWGKLKSKLNPNDSPFKGYDGYGTTPHMQFLPTSFHF